MANTPVSSLPIVALTDIPDANAGSVALTNALDHIVIPKYATTTARDSANPSPTEGDTCYVNAANTTKGYYCYNGGWVGPTMLNQAWTSYTPTWNTSTGLHTPSIGNGVFSFKYLLMARMCFVQFQMTCGTTTNFNSGGSADNWQWSLPKTIVTTCSTGFATFNSATTTVPLQVLLTAGNSLFTLNMAGAEVSNAGVAGNTTNGGAVDALTPFTWTASSANYVAGSFFYEI